MTKSKEQLFISKGAKGTSVYDNSANYKPAPTKDMLDPDIENMTEEKTKLTIKEIENKIDTHTLTPDGSEFLTRNGNQGGVLTLISWNKIYGYWQSKGKPILNLQDTHWLNIPSFKEHTDEKT